MIPVRFCLAFAVIALTLGPAFAADPPKIERTLGKEPSYRSKPEYCLLAFGPEAKTCVWLVLDGNTLYVDKNGNSDLTDAGEALVSAGPSPTFNIEAIADRRPSIKHTALHVSVTPEDKQNKRLGSWFVQVNVEDRYQQYAYVKNLGHKPSDAPVIHFGGPLKMHLWSKTLVRGDQPSQLEVAVVTQYPGVVWAAVRDGKGVPKEIHPVAQIVFAAQAPGAQPITVKMPLKQRC